MIYGQMVLVRYNMQTTQPSTFWSKQIVVASVRVWSHRNLAIDANIICNRHLFLTQSTVSNYKFHLTERPEKAVCLNKTVTHFEEACYGGRSALISVHASHYAPSLDISAASVIADTLQSYLKQWVINFYVTTSEKWLLCCFLLRLAKLSCSNIWHSRVLRRLVGIDHRTQ